MLVAWATAAGSSLKVASSGKLALLTSLAHEPELPGMGLLGMAPDSAAGDWGRRRPTEDLLELIKLYLLRIHTIRELAHDRHKGRKAVISSHHRCLRSRLICPSLKNHLQRPFTASLPRGAFMTASTLSAKLKLCIIITGHGKAKNDE
jgi:hypothetical protein